MKKLNIIVWAILLSLNSICVSAQVTNNTARRFVRFTGAPSTPFEGDVYYNLTTHIAYFYNGTSFVSMSGGGGGANPAGSGTELQYRFDATTFGALSGSSVSGSTLLLGGPLTIQNGAGSITDYLGNSFYLGGDGPFFGVASSSNVLRLGGVAGFSASRAWIFQDASDYVVGRDTTDTLTNKTLTTPTIASFVNATHLHTAASGGGQLTDAALSAAVSTSKGGTGQTVATDDTLAIYNGTGTDLKALPNCTDSSGNHLNYTTATNTISCGTSTPTGVTATGTVNAIPKVTNATGPVYGDSALSDSSGQLTWTAPNNAAAFTITRNTTGVGTITTNGTTAITGSGTAFLSQVRAGDTITPASESVRTVASVTSDTALTLTVSASGSHVGGAYTLSALTPAYRPNGTFSIAPSYAQALGSEAYGQNASCGTTQNCVAIGNGAVVSASDNGIAIGRNATATAAGIAIGSAASAPGSLVIGTGGTQSGNNGTMIGMSGQANGAAALGIGENVRCNSDRSVCLGRGATSTATHQFIVGSTTASVDYITDAYINAVTDASPTAVTLHLGSGGSGSNVAGAIGTIQPGNGTGTGGSGSLIFQTAPVAGSSSTANTMATALTIGNTGLSTFSVMPNDPGHIFLAADGTTTSASLATTGLSITVTSGRKYSFVCELFLSDSVAADGAVIDFGGGAATSTNFRAQVTAFDTALNLSTQLTSLTGTATATTFTGAGAFEVHGSFEPSSTGTWIPRYAQNAHTTGTLTIARGSYCKMWDMN